MSEEIMALCRAMGIGPDREELLFPLVRAVCEGLASRLKPGTAPEDCGSAFPLAAAMMAAEELAGMTGEEFTSFTAGDLTIRREAGSGGNLSARAEELLRPWLRDGGFAFRGVAG